MLIHTFCIRAECFGLGYHLLVEVLELCTTSHKAQMQAEEFIQVQKKVCKKMDDGKNTDKLL